MSKEFQSVLYLNIIVKDGTKAVKEKVKAKIDATPMPKAFKDAAKSIGSKAASQLATPSVLATKMSEKMPQKMPQEMAEKGMDVEVECVFVEGPYLVLQLQVLKVNSVLMAEVKALENSEKDWTSLIGWLKKILEWLGAGRQQSLEEQYLPRVVQRKMERFIPEMLKIRLEEEMKMDAETMVLNEEKQARYFFKRLKELRESKKDQ